MRTSVTLAQTLLITSLVNSAFAVPAPAPQVHDKRLSFQQRAGKLVETYKQDVKENSLIGLFAGVLTALGTMGQKAIVTSISGNTTRRGLDGGTPGFPLKGLASPSNKPASSSLIHLNDGDLRWLSAMTRRAIEELD